MTRLVITPSKESEITLLQRKLRGLPERKAHIFSIDKPRDSYKPPKRTEDAGLPVHKTKRKPGRKAGNRATTNNRQQATLGATIPFICKYCGKKSIGSTKGREVCSKKCSDNAWTKRKRETKNDA